MADKPSKERLVVGMLGPEGVENVVDVSRRADEEELAVCGEGEGGDEGRTRRARDLRKGSGVVEGNDREGAAFGLEV